MTGCDRVGVVAIGRNEGLRLQACLTSLRNCLPKVIYVDSGSKDQSVSFSRSFGAEVVELDLTIPFTAARARNAGFARLIEMYPDTEFVFFVDGDCEVEESWLSIAVSFLQGRSDVAVVCGIRSERFPEKSIYNRLCDIEWKSAPFGEVRACGGDALIRASALRQVGGYNGSLICGEEPDLCLRLRQVNWRIWHLDRAMTVHDAAILRFGQWWRRTQRAGYAFAQGAAMHGAPPEYHWVSESRRAWIWGLAVPLLAAFAITLDYRLSLLVLGAYPLQYIRLALYARSFTTSNRAWALAMVVGKFPEMLGQVQYLRTRYKRSLPRLIEYK